MNAFWASENLLAFIVFRSSQPSDHAAENSSFKWSSFLGSDQNGPIFGMGWTDRSYSKDVAPERITFRTTLRETPSSRQIALIDLP
jgi:hypothetical protein